MHQFRRRADVVDGLGTPNWDKERKGDKDGSSMPAYSSLENLLAYIIKEVTLFLNCNELRHRENKERPDTYFEVQDQKFQKMDNDRELKEKAEEHKLMSTDTTNMGSNRMTWFADECNRIIMKRKP